MSVIENIAKAVAAGLKLHAHISPGHDVETRAISLQKGSDDDHLGRDARHDVIRLCREQ